MSARATASLDHLIRLKAEARGFSFLSRQPLRSLLAGRHASRLRGRGLTFEELRRYHEGDDIRSIDWRATARLRAPHVRVYTEERERPVMIVVDQRQPMFFGSRRAMKSVAAVEAAALAAWRTLAVRDRVGGIVFNEAGMVSLRPRGGSDQALRLMNELVRFNRRLAEPEAPRGEVGLNEALDAVLRSATHDYLILLISDLDGADTETEGLVTRLAARHDMLVIAVYDPLGASLQGRSGMIAATAREMIPIPPIPAFDEAFQQTFTDLLAHWRAVFRALRVPVLPLSTSRPPAEQIRALFGGPAGARA